MLLMLRGGPSTLELMILAVAAAGGCFQVSWWWWWAAAVPGLGCRWRGLLGVIRPSTGLYCLRLAVCVLLFRRSYNSLRRCPAFSVVVGAVL